VAVGQTSNNCAFFENAPSGGELNGGLASFASKSAEPCGSTLGR